MKFALTIFPTDEAIRPDELARAAEDRGFESLFFPEHTHIPCSRKTPYPAGGELPREYTRTHDPFVALTMAAAVTKKIKLATGICLVIERDPITTAKEVASLDYLSGGRAMLGIGAGWNVEEMGNHGTDFKSRWQLLRERVEAMKAIWQHERAEYHGKLVGFDPIWSFPKPVQKPHPPVLLGGEGSHTLRRVVEFCDGWFPRGRAGADTILAQLADLRAHAARVGRDPKTISISVFGGKPDAATFDRYRAAGIERVLLPLPSEGREQILPLLDQYAGFLR
jgi:probable F420-dependent oxidoreductase